MKKLLAVVVASLFISISVPAAAKVCFACRNKTPAPYVCAKEDTWAARHNAKKIGCDITSYSSICKCGAWVGHKKKNITAFLTRLGY